MIAAEGPKLPLSLCTSDIESMLTCTDEQRRRNPGGSTEATPSSTACTRSAHLLVRSLCTNGPEAAHETPRQAPRAGPPKQSDWNGRRCMGQLGHLSMAALIRRMMSGDNWMLNGTGTDAMPPNLSTVTLPKASLMLPTGFSNSEGGGVPGDERAAGAVPGRREGEDL